MKLFDWLAPPRRCVMLGCTRTPRGRAPLCPEHELEHSAKIRAAAERIVAERRAERAGGNG